MKITRNRGSKRLRFRSSDGRFQRKPDVGEREERVMVRCNYCNREARTILRWNSWIVKRGHRQRIATTRAACRLHESCVNFVENMRLRTNATVEVRE